MPDATISPEDAATPAYPPPLMTKSLWVFDMSSGLRSFAINTVRPGGPFDKFILFMIIANSIVMALTDYSVVDDEYEPNPDLPRNQISNRLGPIFNWSFILECVLKIIAFGFALGPNAFIKDGWNKLDFGVVIIR